MHRASTRYPKHSSSTKARQGPGQFPDALQVGEGGDLRRKILQRTHSIASRSTSNSPTTTTSSGGMNKSRSSGLESYYMPAFLSSTRRPPSSLPPSPSQGNFPSPGPFSAWPLENHHRYSFYSSPKQVPNSQAPGPKDREREDVDITDYYSESMRMRGLCATQFSDLPNPPSPSTPPSSAGKREDTDSVKDLDFGLQMLFARQLFGINGVPGARRGKDRNSLNSTFGSAGEQSHVHSGDGDIGEGLPIDSDSDRRRGVSFNMSMGEGDAGTNDSTSVDGFDIGSEFSTISTPRQFTDAVELSRNDSEDRSPAAEGDITNSSNLILDSPFEADICDVELTSLTPRVGCEHTFMNFTPPHVFDAFPPMRPPTCRIRTVSQLPTSVF